MGQARRRDYSTSNAMQCLQDTQSFSTFFDKGWEHYVALIKRSLPLALPMNDDLKTFWHSIYKAIEAPAKDLKPFSDGSDFVAYVEGMKGKLLVLIDDIDKLATASPLVYREISEFFQSSINQALNSMQLQWRHGALRTSPSRQV